MRKLKYNEETKIISFRVPVTKIPEVREKVNNILLGIKENMHTVEFVIDEKKIKNFIKKEIPKYKENYKFQNECDCYLDAAGFLRRGKVKCVKSKKEHNF